MNQKEKTIQELKNLKETAKAIALGAHQLGISLEDVAQSINAIKPIEAAIDKSIIKLQNKKGIIPKQSVVRS